MRIVTGDLFSAEAQAICITTNGVVRANGQAVMGAGVAKQAVELYPGIDFVLGRAIRKWGNHAHLLTEATEHGIKLGSMMTRCHLVSFPTKPAYETALPDLSNVVEYKRTTGEFIPGARVPGFYCVSPLSLIEQSVHELVQITDATKWTSVALPPVGTGHGGRAWPEVEAILERYLDDRFTIVKGRRR